ncbi:hypothetical protein [Mycobacterium sp. 155]|uniref:hypothetical protein n=1 Tax=Mycobacterium sp. 155 TaxID=1157943 RepID=UPI00035C56A7|nr:hypothetical protein [Mycobacterium sp. 155]
MVTRTVAVAVWSYLGSDGRRRRGYYGQDVTLTDDEAERGDQAGALAPPAPPKTGQPAAATEPVAVELEADHDEADDETDPHPADDDTGSAPPPPPAEIRRPAKAAAHDTWVEYAVAATAHTTDPITREQADAMTKTELIATTTERH